MVNVSLIETILHEQDDPGCSTTREIRNIYNTRSGEDPIIQNSDEDNEFQLILLKAIQALPTADDNDDDDDDDDDEDKPISYTVKLKDSDEKKPSTTSSITKPFSPLFLNNMKKFGVSSDWLAKRSNLLRQTTYSRSSVESNTSKLDAMIKSASTKPIRSNRKLSFVETITTTTLTNIEIDKENTDPLTTEINDNKEESNEITKTSQEPTSYDFSSDIDEDKENEKDDDSSPTSKEFSLRIPRVNLSDEENKQVSKRSSLVSSDDESKQEKIKPKKKRKSKKEKKTTMNTTKNSSPSQDKDKQTTTNDDTKNLSPSQDKDEQTTTNDDTKKSSSSQDKDEQTTTNDDTKNLSPSQDKDKQTTTNDDTKKSSQRKSKSDQAQARIEHLKKLLRISGIRFIIKKNELDEFRSNKAKIDYLKSLFDKAGYTGNLSIKECGKFRKKRDTEKELLEIQANAVHVKGHMKGGRTLRGEGRNTNEIDTSTKRKRTASSEIEDDEQNIEDKSSDNERTTVKKRRIMKMEASPEVSENE
ncbi:unnamed protein product [Rotaria sp. Silwood1]|nr:unnamed protein product [Rotaria sp. Silwood1]CAF1586301.1 unnamed protein product [Rotaria sp. Silwood1]CAF4696594.1 unnamed protein product [Rotaria sp. Silwood1]